MTAIDVGNVEMKRDKERKGSLMEVFVTQAAGALLGLNVSLSSDSYVFVTSNLVSI